MALSDKSFLRLTENDLLALIADKEAEGKTLDYKRDLVWKGDTEKKEFLYDVSSFANTQGGHLVFGMEEENGEPIRLVGLAGIDPDKEILRLQETLRDGIRPPIIGVQFVRVLLSNGNAAIVMQIPKSWNPPHQVTYQKAFRFYGRATNGKYQLDVDELRSVFLLSTSAAERLKLFRIERIAKIVAGDTPLPLENGPKMITHILPLAAFTSRTVVDLNLLYRDRSLLVGLLQQGGGPPLFNVDGLLLGTRRTNGSGYVQVFRDGCVEVISAEANQRASLPCPAFERTISKELRHAKLLFQCLGVAPPIVVMLTMTGMKGWKIATQCGGSAGTFDRDPVFIPELVLESFDGQNQDEVKPLLDTVGMLPVRRGRLTMTHRGGVNRTTPKRRAAPVANAISGQGEYHQH